MVHKLIKKTAKELAGAFFEEEDTFGEGRYIRTNSFRLMYGATEEGQKRFVAENWTDFVKLARKILAQMLESPGRAQSEKDQIYDALLAEHGLLTDEDMIAPHIMRPN